MAGNTEQYNQLQMDESDIQPGNIAHVLRGNRFFVLVTGETLNSDKSFIHQLKSKVPSLKEVKSVNDCNFILVFCPVVSRAGTDIERAQQKLYDTSATKPAVLVLLHHTFDPEYVAPDSSGIVQRKYIITFDCLFYENQGLLSCDRNRAVINKIEMLLKPKVSSTNYSEWLCLPKFITDCLKSKVDGSEKENQSEEEIKHDIKANDYDGSGLRLVLLGRNDSWKTVVKNTILGREENKEAVASAAESTATQQCYHTQVEVAGKKLTVVDTPDWFTHELSLDKLRNDGERCIRLSSPGPHAFLLFIPVQHSEASTEEDLKVTFLKMEEVFGEICCRNTIIIFTSADEDQKKIAENVIQSREMIQLLENKCEKRFLCHYIKESGVGSQVLELLEEVEKMVHGNIKEFYSAEIYLNTQSRIGEIERKISEKLKELNDPALKRRKKEQNEEHEYEKNVLHEIWTCVFTSTMKMEEHFSRQIEDKDRQIKEMEEYVLQSNCIN